VDHEEDQEAAGQEPAARDPCLRRLDDLEAEAAALHKETSRLLVQRRKIQARVKFLFKSILLEAPNLVDSHGDLIDHELSATDENALHFEVWFPEFKQITEVLVEENRQALGRLDEVSTQLDGALSERERARTLVDTLETGRMLMADRLEAQSQELTALRKAHAGLKERAVELQTQLAEVRVQIERAPAETDRSTLAETEARLANAEARYQELGQMREKDRIENAREVASLTRQLSQLRERYESQLAQLAMQNERLTETLVDKERGLQHRGGPASAAASPAPARVAHTAAQAAESDGDTGRGRRKVESLLNLDAPEPGEVGNGGQRAASAETLRQQAPPDQVVIFDDEEVGRQVAAQLVEKGFPVTALSPQQDPASQLPLDSIACAVVNLAVPEAWTMVRTLASTRESPPAWVAYAAAHPMATAYWFGEVGFLLMPFENQTLTRVLRRLATRLKQGIVISPDEQIGNEVSQQLGRARVTGAVARDRAQALEVIKAIYPHVALAHLASSPVDIFRAVAALRNVSLFSRIPVVFLLDGTPQSREGSLYSAAVRTILRLGKFDPHNLATALVNILGEGLHIPRKLVSAR
jgi:CheY-like chemotaxis protein